MKEITIPEDQAGVGFKPAENGHPPTPIRTMIGLVAYLEGQVWSQPYWRSGSVDRLHCALRVIPKFIGKQPGDKIRLADRDHEMVVECALLGNQNIAGQNALSVLTLLASLVDAKDVKEKDSPDIDEAT